MVTQRKKITSKALLSASCLAIITTGAATGAVAQGDEASSDDDDVIIVSATRRDADILDVPIAITALQGEDLERNLQDDFSDYLRQVPGVSFTSSGTLQTVSIRGVSGGGGQRAKAPVSFYIDDVPVVSDPVATPDIKTFDIERVEVLRGPQGTLFGESAIGGVIRVISKQPNLNDYEVRARGTYLNVAEGGSGYGVDAVVNLPIIQDKFAIRASVTRRDEAGFIDNIAVGNEEEDVNDLDLWSTRIKALYQVTDNFSVSGTAFISRSEYGGRNQSDDNFEQAINIDENRIDDIDQFNVTLKYDLGGAEITSSTNFFERDTSRLFDLTFPFFTSTIPGELISLGEVAPTYMADFANQTLIVNDESFIQELRIVSPSDQAFRWVGGLYYFDTDNFVSAGFFLDPAPGDFNLGLLERFENYQQFAIFGETEYDISDNFTAVFGLRYTKEDRVINYVQTADWPGPFRIIPEPVDINVPIDFEIFTPKFALQYSPIENTQFYASATRGFRGPGGDVDFDVNDTVLNNIIGAETVWTYEVGSKGRYFDGDLYLEGAFFYTDWTNRQEVVNPQDPPFQQFAGNVGSAEVYGFEVATSYDIQDYITIGGTGTYISTEITDSARPEFVGLPLTNEPEWRGSGFIDLNYPLSNNLTLNGRFDATFVGTAITSLTSLAERDSYTLLNLSAGVRSDKWGVSVFARNLTNEFIRFGSGFSTNINDPRVIGVALDLSL